MVCSTDHIPQNVLEAEHDWKALEIEAVLDFSLVGILNSITNILAHNEISVFVISTFNTDYVLVKADKIERAVKSLRDNNYNVI